MNPFSPIPRASIIALNKCAMLMGLAVSFFAGCAPRVAPREALPPKVAIHSTEFRQTIGSVLAPGFVAGNKVRVLQNGDEIFPAMLTAIRSARRSINFETYVFDDGEIPQAFVTAFEERARAGVRVHLILDAVGASKSRSYQPALREAGVKIEPFHRVWWLNPKRSDYRTHRKILVVDGKVGFTGGVGIADQWKGNASSPDEWRDLHFRVEGPVVAQLQGAFAANWFYTHGKTLQGQNYFPALAPAGPVLARIFVSTPRHAYSAVEVSFQLAIASARHSLLIESPYFVPSDPLMNALCAAARRGVHVRILMPGEHNDSKAVRRASRRKWPALIAAGVELYEYQPTMIHTKLLIADGLFVSIGSSNFDGRSLRINDEANLNALDASLARELTRIFQRDLLRAKRLTEKDTAHHILELPAAVVETPVESEL